MIHQEINRQIDIKFLVARKAVSYIRVSTDDQADYGTSLDSQKRAIEASAQTNDIEIVAHFEDDFTGRKLERPGFSKVRKYLQNGLANVLIVYKGDRLSRHRTHMMMIVDELQALNCELHLANKGQIDLTDDTAVLILSIEGHLAHKEVNDIVERFTRGRLEKALKGQVMGALAPYGYQMERTTTKTEHGRIRVTNRRLVIDPQEAHIIKLIFELFVYQETQMRQGGKNRRKGVFPSRYSASLLWRWLVDRSFNFRHWCVEEWRDDCKEQVGALHQRHMRRAGEDGEL